MISKNCSLARLKKLQKSLSLWNCEAAIVENPLDLFYLTGLRFSSGSLLLDEKNALLLVDGRYIEYAEAHSPLPVFLLDKEKIKVFLKNKRQIAFDSANTSYARYQKIKEWAPLLVPIPQMLKDIRACKDAGEKKKLRSSFQLLWKGFIHLQGVITEGISEKKLAEEFEIFCRGLGAEKMAFDPIIAFGPNSAMPHHHASNSTLRKGDIILLDIGIVLDSYCSDMTRTLFFGEVPDILKKMQLLVMAAQRAALDLCKPGTLVGELDRAARKVFENAQMDQYFIHSLGHGIGLETHEFPRLRENGEDRDVLLEPGMAITIEPGLYLPGKGGVRQEDAVVITQGGYESLC